ncbi:MAG: hypothetical protein SPE33_04195 [[Pasteurella] aerogenes]|nr:hypothetical protein [[Pasteurella] aerogenes]
MPEMTFKSTNLSCNTKDPVDISLFGKNKSISYSLKKGETKSFSLGEYGRDSIKLVIDKSGTSSCYAIDVIIN